MSNKGKLSFRDSAFGVIGAFAALGAVALTTEPAVSRFWLKLEIFVAVAAICVLLTKKKLAFWGVLRFLSSYAWYSLSFCM